jgi:hypothetical protein
MENEPEISNPPFSKYIERVFAENGADFEKIQQSLKMEDKNRLLVNAHFYYYICLPDKNEEEVRSEMRIVGITSLIEAMMPEVEFKDFFQYFESTYKGKDNIESFKEIKEEYLSKHGASRKIRAYFDKFVTPEDKENFCDGIEKYNKDNFPESPEGKELYKKFFASMDSGDLLQASLIEDEIKSKDNSFIKIPSNDNSLPNLLYQMRSDFVHKAEMRGFCSNSSNVLAMTIGKEYYNIEVDINSLLKIFERSFVKFWLEKAENNNKLQ